MSNKIELLRCGIANYSILCTSDERWEPIIRRFCEKIQNTIHEMTGVMLPIVDGSESTAEDTYIIVGPSDEVCDRFLMKDVRCHQYIVKTSGKRIVLGAWLDHPLLCAVERFLEICRENAVSGKLVIDAPDEVHSLPTKKRDPDAPNAYRHFVHTYYYGPTAAQCTDELVRLIKECGITRLQLSSGAGREDVLRVAELAKKYGMDISIRPASEITNGMIYNGLEVTDEELSDAVAELVAAYGDIPEVVEWYVCDEPPIECCERLGRIVRELRKQDPARPLNINHFPISSNSLNCHHWLGAFETQFEHDMMSYDRYKIGGDIPRISTRNYFESLMMYGDFAHRNDLPCTMILQLTAFQNKLAEMLEEQIRWEDNMCLVYGYQCVSYFTMHYHRDDPDNGKHSYGMFTPDWKPTRQYEAIRNVAPKINSHGELLVSKKFEMVYHLNTDQTLGAPKYIPFGDLGEIEGENAVIGFFSDGTFFLVNHIFFTDAPMNTITIGEYNGVGLEWYDTSDETWKDAVACENITLTERGYEISLASGDAEALRVKK